MDNYENKKVITKSIKFDLDLHETIIKLAIQNERDFSKQVKFMLKKYLDITSG